MQYIFIAFFMDAPFYDYDCNQLENFRLQPEIVLKTL